MGRDGNRSAPDVTALAIFTADVALLQAASFFGCEVDTLTLSVEQKKLAEERVAAAGLSDKIRVHLMDYRDIPESFRNAFDAFVSIEMLEVSLGHCH